VGGRRGGHSIQLWRENGEAFDTGRRLEGHQGWITNLAWSPDNTDRLASASADRTVRIWDVTTGETVRTLAGHEGIVVAVSWAPDGRTLATRSLDGTFRLWDTDTGEELAKHPAAVPTGEAYWAAGLAFHADAPVLAVAEDDQRRTMLWNLGSVATALPGDPPNAWLSGIAEAQTELEVPPAVSGSSSDEASPADDLPVTSPGARAEDELSGETQRLVVFHTATQTTELVATPGRLQLYLHDQRPGRGGLQWTVTGGDLKHLLQPNEITVTPKSRFPECGVVTFARRNQNWLYSKALYPDPGVLQASVLGLISFADTGHRVNVLPGNGALADRSPFPSLRILVVGSRPRGAELECERACIELGLELSARGHTLVINSWNPITADRHVLQGVNQNPKRRSPVYITLAPGYEVPQVLLEELQNVELAVEIESGSRRDRYDRQLNAADLLLTIGGEKNTRWVADRAGSLEFSKPVVAVGSFGDASREIWESCRDLYLSSGASPEDVAALGAPWAEGTAAAALRIAELLAGANRPA
jgi:hypothetical protein